MRDPPTIGLLTRGLATLTIFSLRGRSRGPCRILPSPTKINVAKPRTIAAVRVHGRTEPLRGIA